jgi:uncharacterized protein (TIGR01370 family)
MITRRQTVIGAIATGAAGMLARPRLTWSQTRAARSLSWAVYYRAEDPPETFDDYDLLVLDREAHPDLEPLSDAGKQLFGYVSLGEVNARRPEFERVQGWDVLRGENPYWEGSHFVDVRDQRWAALIVEEIVPDILRRGFQGLFLDTLDNPVELERRDPKANLGMTRAAGRLVKALRLHWPRVPLIMNRGYGLLPAVGGDIAYVLGESVFADYDFDTRTYRRVETDLYREQVDILKAAARANPTLGVLTLDYWDPVDADGIREIYREQRANGFAPYVATVELDRVVPEPRS